MKSPTTAVDILLDDKSANKPQIQSEKVSLATQVKMLLWKNFLLKSKRPFSTICELFLPLIIVLLLSALRSLDSLQPKSYEIQYNNYASNTSVLSCDILSALNGKIAIVPDKPFTRKFGDFLERNYCVKNSSILFTTEDDLNAEISSDGYTNTYEVAIVFKTFQNPYSYSLRTLWIISPRQI
jgi:hypothetical protein